ncbi:hypothetical protein DH2020_017058 [Rehmannia glutinosa]|uniref:Aminotransferase-like plant mobile domain-containing protein n=1 Tax=Rehmannia glutinosa TaxID=99300 RepID=A0ABR0WPQ5_REHGL
MSKAVGDKKVASKNPRKKGKLSYNDTKSDFLTQCRPKGLFDVVKYLTDSQIEDVKNIGFGGLLNLNIHHLPAQMIPWLVQRFNGKSRLLSIDERTRFVITADDICDVFMIPRTDREVLVFKQNDSLDPIVEFKKKVGIDGTSSVGTLKSKLMGEFKERGDDFKRMFVLYSLSTFLTPTANRTIDFSCFKSLLDVDAIAHFDWCSLVLEILGRAVDNFNKKSTTHISGCILALQIIYLHRLKWQGVVEPFDLPLIQDWTTQRIRKRVKEERSAGEFGQGEWVEDVFPIYRKTKPVVEEKIRSSTDGGMDERGKLGKEHVEKEKSENFDESSRIIKFVLPEGQPTDDEIEKLLKMGVYKACLLLKRDMEVIRHVHMERLRFEMQREQANTSSSPDDEFFSSAKLHEYIDEVVKNFQKMKERNDPTHNEPMPSFDLLTPDTESPVVEEQPTYEANIDDDVMQGMDDSHIDEVIQGQVQHAEQVVGSSGTICKVLVKF